jgi:hypothetical protein
MQGEPCEWERQSGETAEGFEKRVTQNIRELMGLALAGFVPVIGMKPAASSVKNDGHQRQLLR